MGIYVSLDIFPDRIDADAWRAYYEHTLRFLRAFPEGTVVDSRQETVGRFKRWVYTRDIERDANDPTQRRWRIVGTLEGLKTAEDFDLWADLEAYRRQNREDSTGANILDTATQGHAKGARRVFDAKTQGEPYHFALLAIATLAEWRFPGSALAGGTIDSGQAEQARALLRDLLGEVGPLPLLTDPARLYPTILASGRGVAAVDRFMDLYRGEQGEGLAALVEYADPDSLATWFERQLAHYQPGQLGVHWLYSDWLNATRDVEGLARMACLHERGPRFAPHDFVEGLAATGVALMPEEGARLAILQKGRGDPGSVAYQFGTAFLDASGLQARRSTCFLGEAVVGECLARLFPDQRATLAEALRKRTAALREQAATVVDAFERLNQQAHDDPETGDAASLLDYTPGAPLSEMQSLILDAFAGGIDEGMAMLRTEIYAKLPPEIGPREVLLGLCDRGSIALSEDAWAWIDAETDPDLIALLALVASIQDRSESFTNLRRAIMTHRELCVGLKDRANRTGSR
jgi:hypothetical protein